VLPNSDCGGGPRVRDPSVQTGRLHSVGLSARTLVNLRAPGAPLPSIAFEDLPKCGRDSTSWKLSDIQ
jgi:hypothetical protein